MELIDLDALKEWIESWLIMNKYYHPRSKNKSIPISELYDYLKIMPKVELVYRGHWIKLPIGWKCSHCGEAIVINVEVDGKFCPHCGAKMEGGKDNDV